MKILQISRQFLPSTGGIENVMYGLSKALQKKDYSSNTLTLRSTKKTGEILENESEIEGLRDYR